METKDTSLIKTELIIKIFNLLRDNELTIAEAQDIIEIIEIIEIELYQQMHFNKRDKHRHILPLGKKYGKF